MAKHTEKDTGCQRTQGGEKVHKNSRRLKDAHPRRQINWGFVPNPLQEIRAVDAGNCRYNAGFRSSTFYFLPGLWGAAPRQSDGRGGIVRVDEGTPCAFCHSRDLYKDFFDTRKDSPIIDVPTLATIKSCQHAVLSTALALPNLCVSYACEAVHAP